MTWTPDKIPVWLRRTPEQQAKDDAYQQELRQAMGPGRRPSPTERHLIRAQAVRISAEAHLNHLTTMEDPDPTHIENALGQLAEAVADQGYFTDAAKIHPNPARQEQYAAIAAAVERDDDDPPCNCPIEHKLDQQTNRQVLEPIQIVQKMVYSQKHRKLMPLIKCVKCGDMNVRPATEALADRMRKAAQAHQEAKRQGARNHGT